MRELRFLLWIPVLLSILYFTGNVRGDFSGGGGGGSTTPGGVDKNVQFNDAAAFGGIANNTTATKMYLQQASTATPLFAQVAAADLSDGTIGTGNLVLANTPTLITPVIGAATGTSLALTGASATLLTAANTGTNYAFQVDTNTVNSANGVKITANTTGSGVTLASIGGTNEPLLVNSKGTGSITINSGVSGAGTINLQTNSQTRFSMSGTIFTYTPLARSATANSSWTYTVGADTNLTAGTDVQDINWNLNRTVQHANGAVILERHFLIQAPTDSFVSSASTITDDATLAISGAPAQGANATITNAWALMVQAGNTQLGRVYGKVGTATATTDWALTSGWGASATISAVTGNDSRGTVTVSTNASDTPSLNPVITLTFKNGTWTTAPFATVNMDSTSTETLAGCAVTTTPTTLVITYIGTPLALSAKTATFQYIVEG